MTQLALRILMARRRPPSFRSWIIPMIWTTCTGRAPSVCPAKPKTPTGPERATTPSWARSGPSRAAGTRPSRSAAATRSWSGATWGCRARSWPGWCRARWSWVRWSWPGRPKTPQREREPLDGHYARGWPGSLGSRPGPQRSRLESKFAGCRGLIGRSGKLRELYCFLNVDKYLDNFSNSFYFCDVFSIQIATTGKKKAPERSF